MVENVDSVKSNTRIREEVLHNLEFNLCEFNHLSALHKRTVAKIECELARFKFFFKVVFGM